jgi:hypothetical protein
MLRHGRDPGSPALPGATPISELSLMRPTVWHGADLADHLPARVFPSRPRWEGFSIRRNNAILEFVFNHFSKAIL